MSNLIKQKQVDGLISDLANKALTSQVLGKSANLSDVLDIAAARTNLDIHSKAEVNALIGGANNGISVANITARNALTGLKVSDRIFVSNDGDGKWAMYIVTAITNGNGSSSQYVKVADEDLFSNAMTAAAVKSAYESNANTNEFSDAEQTKLGHIAVTQSVNLDNMESEVSANATAVAAAQSSANAAQSTATAAQNTANTKQNRFTETKEAFTGMTVEAGVNNELSLAHNIKAGFEVLVYFGTLLVENITWTAGGNTVGVKVPYITEPSDKIYVVYKY
jgi:hypothetical protein